MRLFKRKPPPPSDTVQALHLCINNMAHGNPDLYCVFCGWTDPRLVAVASGVVGPQ